MEEYWSITSLPISPTCLASAEKRWILEMTRNYHKLNKMVTSIEDVNFQWSKSIQLLTADLVVSFFPLYLLVNTIKRSFLSNRGRSNTPSLGYFTSALYNNPVLRDLDCLAIPQDIILVHCIDDVRLIGTGEQEVVPILYTLLNP